MCTGLETTLLFGTSAGTAQSGMDQAQAAQDAANAQAAEINRAAGAEQDAANAKADMIRRAARRQRGEAKAAYSASGVSTSAGTPVVIDNAIAYGGESDALMAILSATRNSSSAARQGIAFGKQGEDQASAIYTQTGTSILQQGASAVTASGWRSGGPGFSGTQRPAPITTSQPYKVNG